MASIKEEDKHLWYVSRISYVTTFHALLEMLRNAVSTTLMVWWFIRRPPRTQCRKNVFYAYYKEMRQKSVLNDTRAAHCHFGIGTTISSGVGNIVSPVGKLWMSFDLNVANADTPILLSIDDMDRLGIYLLNLDNVLVHRNSGETTKITRVNGHPYLQRNTEITSYFTFPEIKRIHRRFGHSHVDKPINGLKRLEISTIKTETRKMLDKIERSCAACQANEQRLPRLEVTIREDFDFNHNIYVEILNIERKPEFHVVDEETRFQAARWLLNVSSGCLWRPFRQCWIGVYLGPPEITVHDAEKNFMGRALAGNADMLSIATKSVLVEAANSLWIVERYHSPLRRLFNIIKKKEPDVENDYASQLTVKEINDSIGLDGLVPTPLVLDALPKLELQTDQLTQSTFKSAVALRKAPEAMSRHFAIRQVSDATSARNGPVFTEIHRTAYCSPVLVYTSENDNWDGPFFFARNQWRRLHWLATTPCSSNQIWFDCRQDDYVRKT